MTEKKKPSKVFFMGEDRDEETTSRPDPKKPKEGKPKKDTANIFELRKKFPHACVHCSGSGGDYIGETVQEITEGLCRECLNKGKCPRCSANLPKDWRRRVLDLRLDPVTCGSCGWEDGDPPVFKTRKKE